MSKVIRWNRSGSLFTSPFWYSVILSVFCRVWLFFFPSTLSWDRFTHLYAFTYHLSMLVNWLTHLSRILPLRILHLSCLLETPQVLLSFSSLRLNMYFPQRQKWRYHSRIFSLPCPYSGDRLVSWFNFLKQLLSEPSWLSQSLPKFKTYFFTGLLDFLQVLLFADISTLINPLCMLPWVIFKKHFWAPLFLA